MSDMSGNGVGPVPPESASPDTAALVAGMLDTMLVLTQQAAMDNSGTEAKDRAQAVLAFSQAIVVLDPSLNSDGVPLQHEVGLEELKQNGQERLAQAKAAAAAPTPKSRKKVVATPTGGGGMTYEEQ